jgi:REP element-mobilizing transposase RayT
MGLILEPPPGFCGLDPHGPLEVYTRNLPHWRQAGATYFVTFHLADALPKAKRIELESIRREWERLNTLPRSEAAWTAYAKQVFRQVEQWMDAGHGACWFRQLRHAAELRRSLLAMAGQRYELGCFVIMANHCHAVMRPLERYCLEKEVGAIKGVVGRCINQQESLQGRLWQEESYDRIIRDAEHLYRVVQYIGDNPRRAGIARQAWDRWVHPDWERAGWGFVDG